jgi:hypothetical protein
MCGISNRLRVPALDRYLHSLSCVYTLCPVSPIDSGCLHSISGISNGLQCLHLMSGISNRLRMSTLCVRYPRLRVSTFRCLVSPIDYGCLHSISGISTQLRVSTLDYGYLYSITCVYTLYPVSQLDYGCLHSMSLSEIKGFEIMGAVTAILWRVGVHEFNSQLPELPMADLPSRKSVQSIAAQIY